MLPFVFFVVWGALVVTMGVRRMRRQEANVLAEVNAWRQHDDLVATPIGELPANEVGHIHGWVAPTGNLLTAPLSGRRCVYYAIEVIQNSNPHYQIRILEERDGVPFTLADSTGEAIVDPACAKLGVRFDHVEYTSWLDRTTTVHDALLARHGVAGKDAFGTRRLEFNEAVIAPGDRLSIVGAGDRRPDTSPSREVLYREPARTRLHLAGTEATPLSILQRDE